MLKSSIVKKSGALRAMLLAGAMAVPSMALAGEVTLKSSDGTVNLVGEFVSFEDNSYVIRTGLGELRVSAERVRCEGADCPEFDVATADVVIAGSDTLGLGRTPTRF
jgi:phosphate transport system substrate-binding protein